MDAGKINSLTYVPAARPSDAAAASAIAARTQAALVGAQLIDSLLDADLGAGATPARADAASARLPMPPAPAGSHSGLPHAPGLPVAASGLPPGALPLPTPLPLPAPAAGVIVSLSAGLLARALELPTAPGQIPPAIRAPNTPLLTLPAGAPPAGLAPALVAIDHDPFKGAGPALIAAGAIAASPAQNPGREAADLMRSATLALGPAITQAASDDRAPSPPPASGAAADTGGEVIPQSGQIMFAIQNLGVSSADRPAASTLAMAQARDAERLAGLALRPEVPVVPRQHKFSRLVLGAVILGALLMMVL